MFPSVMVENIILHVSQCKLLLAPLQGLWEHRSPFYQKAELEEVGRVSRGKNPKYISRRDKIINVKIKLPDSRKLCCIFFFLYKGR